jgi:hypothetical protein
MARTLGDQTVFVIAVALALLAGYLALESVEVLSRPPTHLPLGFMPVPAILNSASHAVRAWCLASLFPVWGALPGSPNRRMGARVGRLLYTGACGLMLLHIAVAFHAGHGWSHARAYRHVEEVSGFGPGLFVNYVFAAIWLVDVVWAWINLDHYLARSRWLSWGVLVFMAFIVFNAAIVFGHGINRVISAGFFLIPLTVIAIARPWAPGDGPQNAGTRPGAGFARERSITGNHSPT